MNNCIKAISATLLVASAGSSYAADCKKVRSDVELPGPGIGSPRACPNSSTQKDCTFTHRGMKIGVTDGIVAWKELSGRSLISAKLPFGAKITDTSGYFLLKQRNIKSRPKLYSIQKSRIVIVSTDLCMIGNSGEWYELVFEFNRRRLVRVIERMSLV